jgi:hypothetical protein
MEDPNDGVEQFISCHKVPIVCPILSSVLPDSLRCVELGRVGRQLMYLQPIVITFEPCPYLAILVVGGVVLHQNGSTARIVPLELLEERKVGVRV